MHPFKRSVRVITASFIALLMSAGVLTSASSAAGTPPSATTGSASSTLPTSATVNGTVNPNGLATTWYFEYGTSTTYGSTSPSNSAGAGSSSVSVSTTLGGLSPATTYHYRLVATSSAGTTDGADAVLTTSALPVAITAAASNVADTTAQLNGIVNPNGVVATWEFQYGTTKSYGSQTLAKVIAAGPSDVNARAQLSGLVAHTTYHYRIVATNSAGTSDGADLTFTTGLPVTINASGLIVTYGGRIVLSGRVANRQSGKTVTIYAKKFNQASFVSVATTLTGTAGSWGYIATPNVRTSYEASTSGGTSSPIVVAVRPAVLVSLLSGHRISVHVVGAASFGRHAIQIQDISRNHWVTIRRAALNASAKATISPSLLPNGPIGIRIAIGASAPGIDQAAPGYLAGFSRDIRYVK